MAAAAAALLCTLTSLCLLYADLCASPAEYRRAPLLGGDTDVNTPDTLLLSGGEGSTIGFRTEAHSTGDHGTTPGLNYSIHTDDTQ